MYASYHRRALIAFRTLEPRSPSLPTPWRAVSGVEPPCQYAGVICRIGAKQGGSPIGEDLGAYIVYLSGRLGAGRTVSPGSIPAFDVTHLQGRGPGRMGKRAAEQEKFQRDSRRCKLA